MGGRGASSGGGGGTLKSQLRAFSLDGGNPNVQVGTGQGNSNLTLAPFQTVGDYTDKNNPELVKWQGQTDDKSASFLAKLDTQTDLAQIQKNTNDPYAFHDNPMQRMVSRMGLNAPPTVMSEGDFDNYVKQTGATVLYRGWSGKDAVDRFEKSPNSHIGNGIHGDGYYFATDKSTAKKYGGTGMKAALSPKARVISVNAVNAEISKSSGKLKSALSKAGSFGTRTYGPNKGQAQMALKMGYNCIDAGWAVIPLTRDAVIVSNKKAW